MARCAGLVARMAIAFGLLIAAGAHAQPIFVETFDNPGPTDPVQDGPVNLIAAGWIFRNQSSPEGSTDWFTNTTFGGLIPHHQGAGSIAANFANVLNFGTISTWAIVPQVADQQAGDVLIFYTSSASTGSPDRLQVRYSPGGGTGTGSSATDVGDFTQLLLDIDPVPNYNSGDEGAWTRWEVELPGSGRVAIRYFVLDAGIFGSNSTYVTLDTLSIEHPQDPGGPFLEGFENVGNVEPGQQGPPRLIDDGWVFRNQSSPQGPSPAWERNTQFDPPPHQGFGFIMSSSSATDIVSGGQVATWAILPASVQPVAGDVLGFYARMLSAGDDDVLEVRYSPSGGTGTGSGPSGIGDFTEILVQVGYSPANDAWNLVQATIPGSGRIALRYTSQFEGIGSTSDALHIDTMGINLVPDGPPIPGPGQTVTWTLADSPVTIGTPLAIVADATVIVDPGVVVEIVQNGALVIEGRFMAHGTAVRQVVLRAPNLLFPNPPFDVFGLADLDQVRIEGPVAVNSGGSILANRCTIADGGYFTSDIVTVVGRKPQYVQIDNCTFTGTPQVSANASISDGMLVVRHSTFVNGSISVLRGWLLADAVTIDGGVISYDRQYAAQIGHLDNVTVRNYTSGGALRLSGGDFFVGGGVVLENNLYPAAIAAGFHPGSTLPLAGNINNAILNDDFGFGIVGVVGTATWPNLDLPYHIDNAGHAGGDLDVREGVTIKFTGGFGMSTINPYTRFRGTPEAPITITRLDPGQAWNGIGFFSTGVPMRMESVIVEGSDIGVIASDASVTIADSILRDNSVGSNSNTFGTTFLRKTQIMNNGVGAEGSTAPVSHGNPDLFGLAMPNAIEGNGIGVRELSNTDTIDARHNWWGHASGPFDINENPGGQGDSTAGAVTVTPFLTARPNFDDHPPVVRLTPLYWYYETGDKAILNWEARDDGGIVSQRVVWFDHYGSPEVILADNLPASQRSIEITIPLVEPSNLNSPSIIRVEAFDALGQDGWDQAFTLVPYLEDWDGEIVPDPSLAGLMLIAGEDIDLCTAGGSFFDAALLLDADRLSIPLGGTTTDCLPLGLEAPYGSTDAARVAYRMTFGAGGRFRWFFSDSFTVRLDARTGDAPPIITMTSPAAGESFKGGSVISIEWIASDDDALRFIDIQASLSGGRSWETIAAELPGSTTHYNWALPASTGVDDLRIRVVARDRCFQNSSSGADVSLSILPGEPCHADCNADGSLNIFDFLCFQGLVTTGSPAADCNADGFINIFDFLCFQGLFTQGCP